MYHAVLITILMLNFHYTDASGISLPVGYEIITKSEKEYDDKKKKWVKKSKFTKNEIMRDKLEILNFDNQLKYRYVLMDKWFASVENLVFIDEVLKKKFVCPLKKNRKVALSREEKDNGKYVSISSVGMGDCSSRLVYLEGYANALKIIKQVSKNGDDDESIYLYLVTNDIDLTTNKILEIYKRRWKIEEYQGLPLEGTNHSNKILKLNTLLPRFKLLNSIIFFSLSVALLNLNDFGLITK